MIKSIVILFLIGVVSGTVAYVSTVADGGDPTTAAVASAAKDYDAHSNTNNNDNTNDNSRQLQQVCDELKDFAAEKDPIFNTKPNSCSCDNGGETATCTASNQCLSVPADSTSGTTVAFSGKYTANVAKNAPGETFTTNTDIINCFTYPSNHPEYPNANVCVTMVYDSLGGPTSCTKITVNGDMCHFCQSCAIPAGQGGGSSFIFNCTNIGFGQSYENCNKTNAAGTVAQFAQNQVSCPPGTSPTFGSSSSSAAPTSTNLTTGGGGGGGGGMGNVVGEIMNGGAARQIFILTMMTLVTTVTTWMVQ